ncbi:MAG: hypothetical protein Q7V62_01190, partial [Actinomycetota bacterium]|nr:hypothetical protein [Actinomycetota bacterium]
MGKLGGAIHHMPLSELGAAGNPAHEFVGTFLLVFLAVGAAVMGLKSAGILAVATAFGFVLVFVAYAF